MRRLWLTVVLAVSACDVPGLDATLLPHTVWVHSVQQPGGLTRWTAWVFDDERRYRKLGYSDGAPPTVVEVGTWRATPRSLWLRSEDATDEVELHAVLAPPLLTVDDASSATGTLQLVKSHRCPAPRSSPGLSTWLPLLVTPDGTFARAPDLHLDTSSGTAALSLQDQVLSVDEFICGVRRRGVVSAPGTLALRGGASGPWQTLGFDSDRGVLALRTVTSEGVVASVDLTVSSDVIFAPRFLRDGTVAWVEAPSGTVVRRAPDGTLTRWPPALAPRPLSNAVLWQAPNGSLEAILQGPDGQGSRWCRVDSTENRALPRLAGLDVKQFVHSADDAVHVLTFPGEGGTTYARVDASGHRFLQLLAHPRAALLLSSTGKVVLASATRGTLVYRVEAQQLGSWAQNTLPWQMDVGTSLELAEDAAGNVHVAGGDGWWLVHLSAESLSP